MTLGDGCVQDAVNSCYEISNSTIQIGYILQLDIRATSY